MAKKRVTKMRRSIRNGRKEEKKLFVMSLQNLVLSFFASNKNCCRKLNLKELQKWEVQLKLYLDFVFVFRLWNYF